MKKKQADNIVRRFTESSFIDISHFYTQENMVFLSGVQFSDEEKYIVRSREASAIPPFLNLKDTLMFFFQKHSETHFSLIDQDSTRCAMIIHHGLKTHRTLKIPFADLSVVFLTYENMDEVLADPKSGRGNYQLNCNHRMINVYDEEFKLFQQVVEIFRLAEMNAASRLEHLELIVKGQKVGNKRKENSNKNVSKELTEIKPSKSTIDNLLSIPQEHPELSAWFPSPAGRRHWKRVLLAPLYHHLPEIMRSTREIQGLFDKKSELLELSNQIHQRIAHYKATGNAFFQKKDWTNAIKNYQKGLTDHAESSSNMNNSDAENKRQMDLDIAALCSNLSLCQLKTGEFSEAVFAAKRAVDHIETSLDVTDKDSKKAVTREKWIELFRMGVALKNLKLYDKAAEALRLAEFLSPPGDKLCKEELEEIVGNQNNS